MAMTSTSIHLTGWALHEPQAVVRESRRLVGLERHYHCDSCDSERLSWSRLSACPKCGDAYVVAVIRRAAVAAA